MLKRVATRKGGYPVRGLTLVELMIVVLIVAVLLTLGIPGYQTTVKNNRMATEVTALRSTLTAARSEAMARRMPVVVCESADLEQCSTSSNWRQGYIAFADADDDGTVGAGDEIFLALDVDVPDDFSIVFTDDAGDSHSDLRFSSRGDALAVAGTFTFCDDRRAGRARALLLDPSGGLRGARDSDDPADGIVNGRTGNVSC